MAKPVACNPFASGELVRTLERLRSKAAEEGRGAPAEAATCSCEGSGYLTDDLGRTWVFRLCPCFESCDACLDGHNYERDERGYEFARECLRCGPPRRTVDALNAARLPQQHDPRSATPKGKAQRELFRLLRGWLKTYERGGDGLTLSGPPGVGKSFALVAALRSIVERRRLRVEYLHVPTMLRSQRFAIEAREQQPEAQLARWVDAEVLGVDELSDLRTEWQRETLSDLLTARYDARRTTIITTNLGEDDLLRMFAGDQTGGRGYQAGARIVSRLAQWAPIVTVGGRDWRRGD